MDLWDLKAPFYQWFRRPWPLNHIYKKEQQRISLLLAKISNISGWGLDVGCGSGDSLQFLPGSLTPLGTDSSFQMAVKTRCTGYLSITATAEQLCIKSGSISLLTAIGLLEYIKDFESLIQEFKRCLLPGGYLLITSSPPGWFTFLRGIGISRISARRSREIIETATHSGLKLVSHQHIHSQDAFLFQLINQTNLRP